MTKYLMAVYGPAEYDNEFYGYASQEEMQESMAETGAFNEKLQAEGYWVFADGLEPAAQAAVVDGQGDRPVVTDGPYPEAKEFIGGFWIIGEGSGEMPGGGEATMRLTVGYDPAKGHYVGSWVGSMMPTLWTYEGKLDDSGKVLTLEAVGPSFTGDGTTATYHDIIEIKNKDHKVLTSSLLGDDGKWVTFMTMNSRRKK